MGRFVIAGSISVTLTLTALAMLFGSGPLGAHHLVIPVFTVVAAVALGSLADEVVAKSGRRAALWLGPACGLAVLLVGALATVVANGTDAFSDPVSFAVRPLGIVVAYGAVPAVLAGLLCGLAVFFTTPRAKR